MILTSIEDEGTGASELVEFNKIFENWTRLAVKNWFLILLKLFETALNQIWEASTTEYPRFKGFCKIFQGNPQWILLHSEYFVKNSSLLIISSSAAVKSIKI